MSVKPLHQQLQSATEAEARGAERKRAEVVRKIKGYNIRIGDRQRVATELQEFLLADPILQPPPCPPLPLAVAVVELLAKKGWCTFPLREDLLQAASDCEALLRKREQDKQPGRAVGREEALRISQETISRAEAERTVTPSNAYWVEAAAEEATERIRKALRYRFGGDTAEITWCGNIEIRAIISEVVTEHAPKP